MRDTSFFLGHHSTWRAAARQELKSSPICGKEQPSEKKRNSCQKVAQFVV